VFFKGAKFQSCRINSFCGRGNGPQLVSRSPVRNRVLYHMLRTLCYIRSRFFLHIIITYICQEPKLLARKRFTESRVCERISQSEIWDSIVNICTVCETWGLKTRVLVFVLNEIRIQKHWLLKVEVKRSLNVPRILFLYNL
jgi:hypothetical protein